MDGAQPRKLAGAFVDDRSSLVGGAVVYDDPLDRPNGLPRNAFNRAGQVRCFVAYWRDDHIFDVGCCHVMLRRRFRNQGPLPYRYSSSGPSPRPASHSPAPRGPSTPPPPTSPWPTSSPVTSCSTAPAARSTWPCTSAADR